MNEKTRNIPTTIFIICLVFFFIFMLVFANNETFKAHAVIHFSNKVHGYDEARYLEAFYNDSAYVFSDVMQFKYPYKEPHQDCKFYSYHWSRWAENHNYSWDYIVTDNHIFVIAYTNEGYILLDQDIITEVGIKLEPSHYDS